MFIGVSGKNCAGKDTVADYLVKKGFEYLSLSDAIRDEVKKRNLSPTRDNLIFAGTQIRKNFGSEELAKRVMEKIEPKKDYVIVSIRNPNEVLELKKLDGFFLVEVIADQKTRFERMKSRNRMGDPKTLDEFNSSERAEAKSKNSASQQLDEVARMADVSIVNDADLSALQKKIDQMLENRGF